MIRELESLLKEREIIKEKEERALRQLEELEKKLQRETEEFRFVAGVWLTSSARENVGKREREREWK
jgi:hypothetical protein